MKDQLKRILNLVHKTGDTMIVTDPNGQDVYVVMGLDQYENLRGIESPEQEADDTDPDGYRNAKQDEGNWIWGGVSVDESNDEEETEKKLDIWGAMKPAGEEGETWDMTKMSEEEVVDLEDQYKKYAQEVLPTDPIQNEIKEKTEEIVPKLAENDDEFGEEQFYLEPIE